jgi:hypothetical protein
MGCYSMTPSARASTERTALDDKIRVDPLDTAMCLASWS